MMNNKKTYAEVLREKIAAHRRNKEVETVETARNCFNNVVKPLCDARAEAGYDNADVNVPDYVDLEVLAKILADEGLRIRVFSARSSRHWTVLW